MAYIEPEVLPMPLEEPEGVKLDETTSILVEPEEPLEKNEPVLHDMAYTDTEILSVPREEPEEVELDEPHQFWSNQRNQLRKMNQYFMTWHTLTLKSCQCPVRNRKNQNFMKLKSGALALKSW
jgi:hypothetical protein